MNETMTTSKMTSIKNTTTQPTPDPPAWTHMIVPIGIETYPYLPKRRLPTAMRTTTTAIKNRLKSHKGHSAKYTPPTPAPPTGRQIMLPRGITAYQLLHNRRFTTTMSATTMTMNKRWKLHKVHSTHARSSGREAYDSALRDYKRPIHSQNV